MTTPAPTPVCTILSVDGIGMDQDGIPCSTATWTGEFAYGPGLDPTPTTPGVPLPPHDTNVLRPATVPPTTATAAVADQQLPVTGTEGTTAGLALVVCLVGVAFVRLARRQRADTR